MQTVDPTILCLISLLILALIGVSMREVDWSKENRRRPSRFAQEAAKRANRRLQNGRRAGAAKRK